MALFGGERDRKFIASIANEVVTAIVDTEIEFFKLILDATKVNIYGESTKKEYYNSIILPCLITKEPKSAQNEDYGHTYTRTLEFALSRDIINKSKLEPDAGDIVFWDNEYYELDNVDANQYWTGKNQETSPAGVEYGYSVATLCEAHATRLTAQQIKNLRHGGTTNIQEYEGF